MINSFFYIDNLEMIIWIAEDWVKYTVKINFTRFNAVMWLLANVKFCVRLTLYVCWTVLT